MHTARIAEELMAVKELEDALEGWRRLAGVGDAKMDKIEGELSFAYEVLGRKVARLVLGDPGDRHDISLHRQPSLNDIEAKYLPNTDLKTLEECATSITIETDDHFNK